MALSRVAATARLCIALTLPRSATLAYQDFARPKILGDAVAALVEHRKPVLSGRQAGACRKREPARGLGPVRRERDGTPVSSGIAERDGVFGACVAIGGRFAQVEGAKLGPPGMGSVARMAGVPAGPALGASATVTLMPGSMAAPSLLREASCGLA